MKYSKSTYLIAATGIWGRFAFILFASSLVMYMMEVLHFSSELATFLYGVIMAMCYLFQLVGGYLTDRYLGNRKAIIFGAVVMLISTMIFTYGGSLYSLCSNTPTHASFIFTYPEIIFMIGVLLFSIGLGFFNVSLTAFLGLFYEGKEELLDSAYTFFYMMGNLGAFFGPIVLCYVVGEGHPGLYQYGFLIAVIVLFIGLISFLMLKDKYLRLENGDPVGTAPILKSIGDKAETVEKKTLNKVEKDRVKVVILIFMVVITFIICLEQITTSMIIMAMNYVNQIVPVINVDLTPQFFICLNPLFVTIFSPLYIRLLNFLAARDKEPSSIDKLSFGLVMLIISYVFILIPTYISNDKISIIWLILFNLFLVFGELLIMPISYSLTSKLASPQHASFIMGALLAVSSVGEILAGAFASTFPDHVGEINFLFGIIPITDLSSFIWTFIIFTSIFLVIWVLLRKKIKELSHGID